VNTYVAKAERKQTRTSRSFSAPRPPPLQLSNGDYIFFYNGATLPNDRQYHVGWAVLAGEDPSKVVHRSERPILSWSDRPWMAGNSTKQLCYTPTVVFCNGARRLVSSPAGQDTFQLFFGGADAVVGTATVVVKDSTRGSHHTASSTAQLLSGV
jgi:predicted GH43/DUF377 family glycosyl hydrolase